MQAFHHEQIDSNRALNDEWRDFHVCVGRAGDVLSDAVEDGVRRHRARDRSGGITTTPARTHDVRSADGCGRLRSALRV